MAARPRSRSRRDWPPHLDETRPGYYVWRNPLEGGKAVVIGRVPLADARLQAIEANLWVRGQTAAARLVDRLRGGADKTLGAWLDEWLPGLDVAEVTARNYASQAKAIKAEIGQLVLAGVATKDCADAIISIKAKRGARTAQACRSLLRTAFTAAIARGLVTASPAAATAPVRVVVQRQRFTWETFLPIWNDIQAGGEVWLRNAVALALVSAQRREDVCAAQFQAFDDSCWRLEQLKGGRRLAIPLDLRLAVAGLSLRDVLAMCRRTGAVSRFLVHQTRPRGNSPVGQPIFEDTVTKRFSEAVARFFGEGEGLPTFHEIRSLSKRLYVAQGGVDTKTLLGHSTDEMSDLYGDSRGAEFEKVRIG